MEYVRLGSAGVKVSRIALGLGFRGQKSPSEAQRTIERAIDLGVNFIDCANVYTVSAEPERILSEEVLAKVLKPRRDELVITSKVAKKVGDRPNDRGSSRYHIMREVERSLSRLGTDHIDVYLLHELDSETPLEETLGALDDLVRQGKIRYPGCCNFAAWEVCKALWTADRIGAAPLVCVQNPYSLLRRDLENEMYPLVRDQMLGVMVYSPLAIGLLSGTYRPGQAPPSGTVWGRMDRAAYDSAMTEAADTLESLERIAGEHGKTVAQVAQNWVLGRQEVTSIISGSDTVEQIEENVGATGWELSVEEIRCLDEVSIRFRCRRQE